MVRITLPNRLKSFNGGGTTSATHSRSTSPNPNGGMKKNSGAADASPEKANGLMLKVVVLKVGLPWQNRRKGV
jgi:phosphatidylserine decarboxylase